MDRISISIQTARPRRGAGHLRPISAAFRMEPLVCFAGRVAKLPLGGPRRGAPAPERAGGGGPLRQGSFPRRPAAIRALPQMAVLVHLLGGEAEDRAMVAPRAARRLRPRAGE